MSLTPLGSLALSAVVPGAAAAAAAGEIGIEAALPGIQAQLTALASFTPTLDLGGLSGDITIAGNILADLQAALALGLTPPSLQAQLDIVAGLVLTLNNLVILINAQLQIILDLIALLATAGVDAYAYDGPADQLGAALTAQYAGDTDHANALVLVTKIGATWTAMSTLFKVTP